MKLQGDDGVLVQAGGLLDLHEARDVRSQSTQVGVTRSGIGIDTTGLPVPDRKGAIDTHATSSDTANATTIESRNGGALLRSSAGATLRGVAIDVAQNATVRGAAVNVTGALGLHTTTHAAAVEIRAVDESGRRGKL